MLNIGIDWASFKHDVVIKDSSRDILHHFSIPHSAMGLASLHERILLLENSPSQVKVALENHDGALLSWLFAQGYCVYAINPRSSHNLQLAYRASGAKDDRADALILAEAMESSPSCLRQLSPEQPLVDEIKCWLDLREEIKREKTAASQRLRALLDQWSPELSRLCADFDLLWQRRLLDEYPLHEDIAAAGTRKLAALAQRLKMRQPSREALLALKDAPVMAVPQARRQALRFQIRRLADQIGQLAHKIIQADKELERLIESHPQKELYQSLPVAGSYTTATAMVLLGGLRDARQAACLCGAAPVTARSGRSLVVTRRRAFDRQLADGMTYFALNSIRGGWARQYYYLKRDGGMGHHAALRCLAQRWIRIIAAMLKTGRRYDEDLHQANRQIHRRLAA